jgi:mannose-6-phosphate isomerase-like protein (cupin superfamily)
MDDRIHIATGEEIVNVRTGQRMVFRATADDSDGRELVIECWSPRHPAGEPHEPVHTHPRQEKRFRMVDGELMVNIDGVTRTMGAGDEVVVPAGVRHSFWNASEAEAHYWQEFRPALRSAEFFSTLFALARESREGRRGTLQLLVSAARFQNEIMVTNPPPWMQRPMFAALKPLAKVLRVKAERR